MICTRNEFASVIGHSTGQVSAWLKQGMPASGYGRPGKRVEIDTAVAIPWLLKRERASAPQRQGGERERLAKAQAERAEFENAVRRGDFVLVDTLAAVLLNVASEVARQLDGLPGRAASEVASMTDPAVVRAKLLDECRQIRSEVAKHMRGIADDGATRLVGADERGVDRRPAAKAVARPVGRQKPRPTARKRRARRVAQ